MQVAVTTPTGHVGSQLMLGLIRAGVRPRLLARHPERLDPQVADQVDVVQGDQGDLDIVRQLVDGVAAVYWVDPPSSDGDPVAQSARMGDVAAAAIRATGVARCVFQSSVGAELREGAGQIDGLARTEVALEASGAAVCHLRCGYFFTNLLMDPGIAPGSMRAAIPLDLPLPWVDPRDIAEVAVGRLLNDSWVGRVVQAVHGPADLSYREVAEELSSALGSPVRVGAMSLDEMADGLRATGMNDEQVERFVGMSRAFVTGFTPEQSRSTSSTTPSTLGGWAYAHRDQLLGRPG